MSISISYCLFSPPLPKSVAETTGGFRGFKLWALAVSGSVVKQSVMVLVVWGSKFSFKCDRNMLGMAAVLYSFRGGAERRPLSCAGPSELPVL